MQVSDDDMEALNELLGFSKNDFENITIDGIDTNKEELPEFVFIKEDDIIKNYRADLPLNYHLRKDLLVLFNNITQKAEKSIERNMKNHGVKLGVVLQAEFTKYIHNFDQVFNENDAPSEISKSVYINNITLPVLQRGKIREVLDKTCMILDYLRVMGLIGSSTVVTRLIFQSLKIMCLECKFTQILCKGL